jgi:hypothetical protein
MAEDPPDMEVDGMLVVDCPWCDDSMIVDDATLATGACAACGVTVEVAPDPVSAPILQVALAA